MFFQITVSWGLGVSSSPDLKANIHESSYCDTEEKFRILCRFLYVFSPDI
jgi:hypothetical protein